MFQLFSFLGAGLWFFFFFFFCNPVVRRSRDVWGPPAVLQIDREWDRETGLTQIRVDYTHPPCPQSALHNLKGAVCWIRWLLKRLSSLRVPRGCNESPVGRLQHYILILYARRPQMRPVGLCASSCGVKGFISVLVVCFFICAKWTKLKTKSNNGII